MSRSWKDAVEDFNELRDSPAPLLVDSTVPGASGSFFANVFNVSADPPLLGLERLASEGDAFGEKLVVDMTGTRIAADEGERSPWFLLALLPTGARISFARKR